MNQKTGILSIILVVVLFLWCALSCWLAIPMPVFIVVGCVLLVLTVVSEIKLSAENKLQVFTQLLMLACIFVGAIVINANRESLTAPDIEIALLAIIACAMIFQIVAAAHNLHIPKESRLESGREGTEGGEDQ